MGVSTSTFAQKRLRQKRLREERIRWNWRQCDVADRVGVTVVTVKRWERGVQRPRAYFRAKLCELFGKNAEELGLIDSVFFSPSEKRSLNDLPEKGMIGYD